jgi:putative ABC transport system permease protein
MLKNYIRIALRSYGKNYLYTLINIVGMAVGLSGVILTFLLYDYENGFDKNHQNTSNIFRVNSNRLIEGESQKWGVVPSALGPIAASEHQAIEDYTRFGYTNAFLVQHEDIIHREQITFADPNLFDLFSFKLVAGQKEVFKDKSKAIISEQFARKYFGDKDPLGKQLTIRRNNEIIKQFVIGAVAEKIPMNSSFQFDIITQYENLLDCYAQKEFDWHTDIRPVLYLKLNKATDADEVKEVLQKYSSINNEIKEAWKINDFYLVPFKEQKDEARFVHSFTTRSGLPISALYGSFIMNGLILLIACFNFTNTSLAYANTRLKEIGIRRTFGGIRWQIIKQFFTENFVLCFIALFLSIELANTWVGWMNKQWPIELDTFYFDSWNISINLIILLFLVSFIAGSYPAFYISRFHPTEILKGKLKLKGNNYFTRLLLVWQFGFSIMAIFSGIVLTQNARFQKTLDWGFDKENTLVIPLQSDGNFTTLKDELSNIKSIQSIAGTVQNLGYGSINTTIEIDGEIHNTDLLLVGDNYLTTIGCKIIEGRNFLINSKNDAAESLIVNEDFVKTFDIKDPLKQAVLLDKKTFHIVGVLKDFMPYGLFDPIKPSIIRVVPENDYQHLVIQSKQEALPDIFAASQASWKQLFPNQPFEGFYMEEVASEALHTNNGILVQFGILGIFALFLSITGLYSIVSLSVNKRIKEIGIRKVLGASIQSVMKLMNYEFGIILIIAIILGCVGGYYFMNKFLSDIFDYYEDIGPLSFIASALIILIPTVLTSGLKIYHIARRNPTESLRYE